MNIKIDRIIYDPIKTKANMESLLEELETSEVLISLFHRMKKYDVILKVSKILTNVFLTIWSVMLILSIWDIHKVNERVRFAVLLIGLALILFYMKCQKDSRKADTAYFTKLHKESNLLRFHNCFYKNDILACYITSASNDECNVRVIAEAVDREIIEQNFHFVLTPSPDTNDIILDIENNCVKYPKHLELCSTEN